MKIRYVTYARIPTRKANGLQISKTCEALAARGVGVELVIPGKNRHSKDARGENIFDFYSLKRNFRVTPVWVPPFLPLGNFGIFLQNIYFFLVAGIGSIFVSKDTIVYSRQPLMVIPALIFGRKAVFESHEGRWTPAIHQIAFVGAGSEPFFGAMMIFPGFGSSHTCPPCKGAVRNYVMSGEGHELKIISELFPRMFM